jgi:hypothetical protein
VLNLHLLLVLNRVHGWRHLTLFAPPFETALLHLHVLVHHQLPLLFLFQYLLKVRHFQFEVLQLISHLLNQYYLPHQLAHYLLQLALF